MNRLEKNIRELLGERITATDSVLIKELIYKITLQKKAKALIKKDGIIMNSRRDDAARPYWQRNPAVTIYQELDKAIKDSFIRLGITIAEREKFNKQKIAEIEEDEFDQDFN